MRKRINEVIKNPIISGGAIVFLGFLSGNFFNFLFNVFMSRNLSVADFGTLSSLVSLVLLCALALDSFIPTVMHFAGTYFAKGEIDKARGLFRRVSQFALGAGGLVIVIFLVFGKNIGHFFNIESQGLLLTVGFAVLFAAGAAINRAFLQAKLSFSYISFINILSSSLKLAIGAGLVLLGFNVHGALWSFLISFCVMYFLMLIPLRFLFSRGGTTSVISIKTLLAYGGPASLALLSLASLISADIILIKHFYSAKDAGIYSGLSLLGRIIYFFSAPIVTVMFPLIVQRHTKNEKYVHLFKISVALIFISSMLLTLFYYLFPEFNIRILLKREEYLVIKPTLWYFGLYMSLYSVLSVFVNFFLSTKRTKVFIPCVVAAFSQWILIWFFHDSFTQIITISIAVVSLLLLTLLLYYWRLYGNRNQQ